MPNEHQHHHDESNIKVAFLLNFSFTLLEIVGGIWTNSVAILSDALHDLGDTIALGLSWYLAKVSKKERDAKFSYGYRRFSLLGALISSLILLVGSVIIFSQAIPRLIAPGEVKAGGVVLFALLGIAVNGIAVLKLRNGKTQNERVVMLHLLEDALGWIAVLVMGIVMLFVELPILDPLLSLAITSYILWNVLKNFREIVSVFLQAIPIDIDTQQLQQVLVDQLPLVRSIHDLHVWTMDGEYNILSFHLVIADNLSAVEIATLKKQVRDILKQHHVQHATIEIEYEHELCELANC